MNLSEENSVGFVLDMADNDADELLNYLEDMFGTDKNKIDTEGDKLTDYEEISITNTNPLKVDSDENGINDGDEDPDKDGISNLSEMFYESYPFSKDSDMDKLSDSEEIKLKTKLNNPDTDNDLVWDGMEVKKGTDPLNPDTNGNGILDGDEIYTTVVSCLQTEENDPVKVSVTMDLPLKLQTLGIDKVSDSALFLNKNVPGFIGNAFDIWVDGDLTTAIIKFEFKGKVSPEFKPTVYCFDEANQTLIELPNQVIKGNTITVKGLKFSKYILLNKVKFDMYAP